MSVDIHDRAYPPRESETVFQARIANQSFDFRTFAFDDRKVTGAQIAEAVGAHPVTEFVVLQQLESLELETLRPTELADLGKRVRFFVIRGDATYRFLVDGLSMEWPLKIVTGKTVKKLVDKDDAVELLLERQDQADRVVADEDEVRIAADGLEKFSTRRAHTHVTIIVNGRNQQWEGKQISFSELVTIAFPVPPNGQNIVYTVTYHQGPPGHPEGSLTEGKTVKVRDRMVFNVRFTDKS